MRHDKEKRKELRVEWFGKDSFKDGNAALWGGL